MPPPTAPDGDGEIPRDAAAVPAGHPDDVELVGSVGPTGSASSSEPRPLPDGVMVRSHPEIRTLMQTSEDLTAWLFDQRTGGVRQLNQAAAAVWGLIEQPVTLAGLAADLAEVFELDPGLAEEVAGSAVDALRAEELLELTLPDGSPVVVDEAAGSDDVDDREDAAAAGAAESAEAGEAGLPALLTRAPDP